MTTLDLVLGDLILEGEALERAISGLAADDWRLPTPAPGWTVATQIAHLAWTDHVATLAAGSSTEAGKAAWDAIVVAAMHDPEGFVDAEAHAWAEDPTLSSTWQNGRRQLAAALRDLPKGTKLPWFGPPMSATSMATARFMETWAHALDVYDAIADAGLGEAPEPTDRIVHVAHLGVRTRDFAFAVHELPPPAEEFAITLVAPSGALWQFGDPEASQSLTGSAVDFCRLVTQRVDLADTDLQPGGPDVETWLGIAQAFAGPPGVGR